MCTTCGCGESETRIDGAPVAAYEHGHPHAAGTGHVHWHAHEAPHAHPAPDGGEHGDHHGDGAWHRHEHGLGAAGGLGAAHAPDIAPSRAIRIEQDLLARNDAYAARNRDLFAERAVFALNLVSSPGSGKTTLLVRTIQALKGRVAVTVIEGDQQTSLDADRIRATGAAAVQVNTGKGCHLDAHMVGHALESLAPPAGSLLLIENVGNLVCPAAFDLGEAHKVVILSVTEGDDKPQKYPDMFHAADLMLINKVDLLPHVQFDVDAAVEYARRVRPDLPAMRVCATTGEGFGEWLAWLERGVGEARARRDARRAVPDGRVVELEAEVAARVDVRAGQG